MDKRDLSALLTHLEMNIRTANDLYGIDLLPRLVTAAIAISEREGFTREFLAALLHSKPLNRRWWLLKQYLSPAAIATLERKSTTFLQSLSHATTGETKN